FTRPIVRLEGTHAIFTTTFLFRISAKSGDVVAFDLNATTELIYSMPADAEIADADLEEFGQVNVPFNAWAYWRELSQSSFCRLGLPPLALPLFRVQDAAGLWWSTNRRVTDGPPIALAPYYLAQLS